MTLGLAYGFWYSYSVFLVAFVREFGWSRSVVAGAFSVLVLIHGVSGPLLGWLVERFGPRGVIATGGVTPAPGSSSVGGPRFARIFGLLHFANSVGGALGAWVAGRIFDATGDYRLALPIAVGMALLAPTLLWIVAPRRPNART